MWVLNLLLPGGSIRPVELDQVSEIRLDDAKLQQELVKALSAVAASRDQDSKPVAIRFSGQGAAWPHHHGDVWTGVSSRPGVAAPAPNGSCCSWDFGILRLWWFVKSFGAPGVLGSLGVSWGH